MALARGEESTVGESYEIDQWAASQPTAAHVDRLANLPHPLDVSGFGPVVFCHGTPWNPSEPLGTPRYDDEVVLVDTRLQRWAEVVSLPMDQGASRGPVCPALHARSSAEASPHQ